MRGVILNTTNIKGLISGDDGNRYEFLHADWYGNISPQPGMEIDFSVENGSAKQIFQIKKHTEHSKVLLAVICWFTGILGIHRFMVGKTGTGILMLVFTLTIIGMIISGIWAFIDFIIILMGKFTDSKGNIIT